MKKVFCMRGLPGSGKNTYIDSHWSNCKPNEIIICSADDYFTLDGEYKFDPTMLFEAHNYCIRKYLMAIRSDIKTVIVNNTNISAWEISPYAAIAVAMGYQFEIIELKCSVQESIARNTHNVPPEIIGAMAEAMRREVLPKQWTITKID